jgi:hypothetical protein
VLDIDDNRHFYTKHGFHLNGLGEKEDSTKADSPHIFYYKKDK